MKFFVVLVLLSFFVRLISKVMVDFIGKLVGAPWWMHIAGVVWLIATAVLVYGFATMKLPSTKEPINPPTQAATASGNASPIYQAGRDMILTRSDSRNAENYGDKLQVAQMAERLKAFP